MPFNTENRNTMAGFVPFLSNDCNHREYFDMSRPGVDYDKNFIL